MNVDKAARYHRLKRCASVAATLLTASLLVALLLTGASVKLRDLASGVAPGSGTAASPAAIGLFVVLLCGLWQTTAFPLAFYSGVVLERRYGLSSESIRAWLRDQAKGATLASVAAVAAVEFIYFTIRRWPQVWWLGAAIGCGGALLLLARAAPVALLPLFFRFKPLDRPPLQARLAALSQRAGIPALGVYEWGLGDKTRRANAALVGVGGTRRILLADTLLADYSDDEIEVILAHELAHHAHWDFLTAVAAQTVLLLVGFGVAALAFSGWSAPLRLGGPGDLAGLPLLLLAVGGVSIAMTPFINALSRLHERRADEYALRLTGSPAAFISAMRRLGSQNLSEPQPSRGVLWLFHSHPPIDERIEAARAFARAGEPRR